MLRSAHSQKTIVQLADIFVFPNLSKINYEDEQEDTISCEKIFFDDFIKQEKILIAGESQSGKTTRRLFATNTGNRIWQITQAILPR